MEKSLTVIMPALDEERYIRSAVASIQSVLDQEIPDHYEILIFNDGSKDETGAIADEIARQNLAVKVIHHPSRQGLAAITRTAIDMASKNYITWYPGDHSVDGHSMRPLIQSIGKADVVIAYMANNNSRAPMRRILSVVYVFLLNSLFGLQLRYYNGASVFPTRLLRTISIRSQGHGFFAEIVIRVLKAKTTYVEVPFVHRPESRSPSKALSLSNIYHIFKMIVKLMIEIYILKPFKKNR